MGLTNRFCCDDDPQMDLAPDAPFGSTMLVGVPLAFSLDLDAGAVGQRVRCPFDPGYGMLTASVF